MVSNASDDLPEPDSPVITTSWSRGISTSTFFRLCWRAPLTRMWLSGISSSQIQVVGYQRSRDWGALGGSTSAKQTTRAGESAPIAARLPSRNTPTQLQNLVAEQRRLLELQRAGRLLHLRFEILDQPYDLVTRNEVQR